MERSIVLIKPDALQRKLVGDVVKRLEGKGLKLVGIKMMVLSDAILEEHYSHLVSKPFFPELRKFMSSTPIIATCWEGVDCVATTRLLCGTTKAREAAPGTIRGDLAMSVQDNLVHASDTLENAQKEILRFFKQSELFEYSLIIDDYIYGYHED
jgi:nucleoside-diphosphate kinase